MHPTIPQTVHTLDCRDAPEMVPQPSLRAICWLLRAVSVCLPPSYPHASQDYGNSNIRRIDLATRETTTVAGDSTNIRGFRDGVGTNAQFYYPWSIDIARSGGFAIVAVRAWPAPPRRAIPRIASAPPRLLAHAVGCGIPITTRHTVPA